jgi:hypothetical protein
VLGDSEDHLAVALHPGATMLAERLRQLLFSSMARPGSGLLILLFCSDWSAPARRRLASVRPSIRGHVNGRHLQGWNAEAWVGRFFGRPRGARPAGGRGYGHGGLLRPGTARGGTDGRRQRQALWTAAHDRVGVVFAIPNNRSTGSRAAVAQRGHAQQPLHRHGTDQSAFARSRIRARAHRVACAQPASTESSM